MRGIAPDPHWYSVLVWDNHSYEEFEVAYAQLLLEAATDDDMNKVLVVYYSSDGEDLHG